MRFKVRPITEIRVLTLASIVLYHVFRGLVEAELHTTLRNIDYNQNGMPNTAKARSRKAIFQLRYHPTLSTIYYDFNCFIYISPSLSENYLEANTLKFYALLYNKSLLTNK